MDVRIGNIFDSKCRALVNTVNCVGVMGKGIAREFKARYPEMFTEYAAKCRAGEVIPGKPYVYYAGDGRTVVNFPTKDHWRSPSKLSYVVDGLNWFIDHYMEYGIKSVAFPPLGCGNGGLSWSDVGPIMYQKLVELPIEIEIYAPYGSSMREMSKEYLTGSAGDGDVTGALRERIRPQWYLILQAVRELNSQRYTLSVGRTIYQKICYVLTRNGVDTGFHFVKGSYGPFSPEVRESLTLLSNANLIAERQLGRMIQLTVSDQLEIRMERFTERDKAAVWNTVNLFSRVKSTDQAEMMATVLYAYDQLAGASDVVEDIEVYEYVLDWKPHWRNQKEDELCETIDNMAMLEQMTIVSSGRMHHAWETY